MHLWGLSNLCLSASYNQGQLTIELIRQAHNRLLEKANDNAANQRKHKLYKRWRHEIRHRGPPVKIAPGPPNFNPAPVAALSWHGSFNTMSYLWSMRIGRWMCVDMHHCCVSSCLDLTCIVTKKTICSFGFTKAGLGDLFAITGRIKCGLSLAGSKNN